MTAMAPEMRKTGIDVVGDMPWGTHFCLFYETKEDLLDTLVSYCKTGLESEEFCLWVVAEPLTIEEAMDALKDAVPDLDRYLADPSIEIVSARDWYLQGGTFDLKRVTARWHEKLARASARGYAGVRVTGDTAWLEKKDWKDFCEYEEGLNEAIANRHLAVLCTYPLAACRAVEVLDVTRTHQFALARRHGSWDVIETAGHKQAKAEIKRLNEELEQRVVERTIRALVNKVPPRKDCLEINEAILEVIALTHGEAVKNSVSLQTQLAAGLPLIQGDRVQLQQVILNLIVNAVEAMSGVSEGSRELLIGTGKDSSGVLVAVQDSGSGLNQKSFDRLFDAFYTTKPGGMGMGLSICRSIVEAHGGRIWASGTAGPD